MRQREEEDEEDGKDQAAKAPGKKGGKARARSLSSEQRAGIARKDAAKRWKKGD